MSYLELIPIGALLSLLTKEVVETALAAKDVLVEKESFKLLSKYLEDIEPVLEALQARDLKDTQAARQALEFLKEDVNKAKHLVNKYRNRARFYLLIKCRHIVKEIQYVTRHIGRSLAGLSLASTEVLTDISEKVKTLHDEMQRAEFEASQAQLRIVEKLDQGLLEQKSDLGFANDMLEEIAKAVGVPVEPTEISRELESFRQEKEEAAVRKEQAEVLFLEQVIKLLSRADAANDQEVRTQYFLRVQTIEKYSEKDYIQPFKAFKCPIERTVMVEPVSLCTGTTCERGAIRAWFDCGLTTDPETGEELGDFSLRLNVCLKQSIEEWRELNYCLKIRSAKGKLLSEIDFLVAEALIQIQELIRENPINKDWVAIEGILDIVVDLLGKSHNKDVKRGVLVTLMALVKEHGRNKDKMIECRGLDHLIPCLGRDTNLSKAAVELLFELLHDSSGWNLSISMELIRHEGSILFLVTILKGTIKESAEKAETILLKICDDNDDNISRVAAAGWYKPLIGRLCQGAESSKISLSRALGQMELVDENIRLLGEEGVIRPLVEMLFGNHECKDAAFSALTKLSICYENKKLIAEAGGVPLILDLMFLSLVPARIRTKCCEILQNLSFIDGIDFLIDASGAHIELEAVVINLLAMQQNPTSNRSIRKPALRSLLSIYKSGSSIVEKTVAGAHGVSVILPLLEDPDQEIREHALNLLFGFSKSDPGGISDFLLEPRRLETFVGFLEDETRGDAQMAAAGLLANLPKSESALTKNLIESDGLSAILGILKTGTMEAKENALGALFRFTDPSNIERQKKIVELGIYPLLVNLLRSGSITSKARSAALIYDLSMSTPTLVAPPATTGCWYFRQTVGPICKAHGAICNVNSSFCLLTANALPALVSLLLERVHETAFEAVQALGTLVQDVSSYGGANVLHEADAIHPLLEILDWGTLELKEEVLGLLEKVFTGRDLAEYYCSAARIPLMGLSTRDQENGQVGRKAASVLAKIERYSKSMPLV
ncbi:U-box domain-containing protein 43-like [Aristolochia californica]|uniref:U-box domain-containing protein 43-like n=1 Tax=Aristolochia californica TaxID=171875 RepID=UPI0035DA8330